MRILVVSNAPLRKDNGLGNSLINIYGGIENIELASVYCRYGKTDTPLVKKSFQITEKSLLKNLKNESIPSGKEVFCDEADVSYIEEPKTVEFARKNRWTILYLIRNVIWKIGRWKSEDLIKFVDDFKPDIIFQPIFNAPHVNEIALFLKKHTGVPMVCYNVDENYSLKQLSFSPFYWIDRLWMRKTVRKLIENCELLYTISKVQKEECEKAFSKPCKILTKCADFCDDKRPELKEPDGVIKMVYAGNISKGRYEILAELAKAVEKLNIDGKRLEMDIYTLSPLTDKQKNRLLNDAVKLYPPVSYNEIREIQKNADILIHAEAFSLKERLLVHQSFSTKIVDYLATNRCIFAIGSDYCASIQYFIDNDCGLVAANIEEIEERLTHLIQNPDLMREYANKAWACGSKLHNANLIKNSFKNDLKSIMNK